MKRILHLMWAFYKLSERRLSIGALLIAMFLSISLGFSAIGGEITVEMLVMNLSGIPGVILTVLIYLVYSKLVGESKIYLLYNISKVEYAVALSMSVVLLPLITLGLSSVIVVAVLTRRLDALIGILAYIIAFMPKCIEYVSLCLIVDALLGSRASKVLMLMLLFVVPVVLTFAVTGAAMTLSKLENLWMRTLFEIYFITDPYAPLLYSMGIEIPSTRIYGVFKDILTKQCSIIILLSAIFVFSLFTLSVIIYRRKEVTAR